MIYQSNTTKLYIYIYYNQHYARLEWIKLPYLKPLKTTYKGTSEVVAEGKHKPSETNIT